MMRGVKAADVRRRLMAGEEKGEKDIVAVSSASSFAACCVDVHVVEGGRAGSVGGGNRGRSG